MSILRLQILVLLSELKKVTTVAEEIGVKQPTVSFHMRKLEEEWGAPLFEIKTGKVLLTESGQLLYRYAAEIDRIYKEAQSRFQAFRQTGEHRLVVGITDTASSLLFRTDWIAQASQSSGMQLKLITGQHAALLEQLQTGSIDFMISGNPRLPAGGLITPAAALQLEVISDDRLALFMSAGHALAAGPTIPAYKLAGQSLVELVDLPLQESILNWETHEKVTLSRAWAADRIDLVFNAVADGSMLAILPVRTSARAPEGVTFIPLPGQSVPWQWTAAWRSDYWNSQVVQRVASLLREDEWNKQQV
ncbi:LysR family transcriptional regulator [Paenibacillus sp. R14(2021)]|uniref:LysR family transcriptional regulator n=1 Tax=Paenibacillus sp. R14(2021) TaxID=2859228 RepID=UPI001C615CDA|nr:LysR family transcriptional regulator [Paenibacillus sp. R14(2021)]